MLVTVVGNYPKVPNLPRPARLRNALARLDRGQITPGELAKVEDEVTTEVIKEQEEVGVELLTDGQIRWFDEQTYIASRLDGIEINGLIRFFDTNTYYREPVVNSAVGWREPVLVHDYRFASGKTTRPVKPVITGPYTLARLSRNEHYDSLEAVAMGFAEALNAEARALETEGPPLIQFNEPAITRYPEDVRLAEAVWKRLLSGIDIETAVYFYFGTPGDSIQSAFNSGFSTIGVDATIPGVLSQFGKGPRPRKLAAGIMDSRTTRLEEVDVLAARIEEALSIVPSEDLYVNPNMGLEFLPREQAQAKLVRLVEAVNKVRGGAA